MGPSPAHRAAFFASFMIAGSVQLRLCLGEKGGRGRSLFHQQTELRNPSPGSRPREGSGAVDQVCRQGPAASAQGGQRRQRHLQERWAVGWEMGTEHLRGHGRCVPNCLGSLGVRQGTRHCSTRLLTQPDGDCRAAGWGVPSAGPSSARARRWDKGLSRYSCASW